MSDPNDIFDNTDIHKCLCCLQPVKERGPVCTPETAKRGFEALMALGFTKEMLLGKHRHQLEYQSPGFVGWLERK